MRRLRISTECSGGNFVYIGKLARAYQLPLDQRREIIIVLEFHVDEVLPAASQEPGCRFHSEVHERLVGCPVGVGENSHQYPERQVLIDIVAVVGVRTLRLKFVPAAVWTGRRTSALAWMELL